MATPGPDDKPIPGPPKAGPPDEWWFVPDWNENLGPFGRFQRYLRHYFIAPINWIRTNVVEANRGEKYYYYHRKFPRVLPIDECYIDDLACLEEANVEFLRNRLVDKSTLNLLLKRYEQCIYWNSTTGQSRYEHGKCDHFKEVYEREEINYFIKYGEMRFNATVATAYNKQKHRMIMDRRRAIKEQEDPPERRPGDRHTN